MEKGAGDISAAVKGNAEDASKESLRINSKYVTDGEVCYIFIYKWTITINNNLMCMVYLHYDIA